MLRFIPNPNAPIPTHERRYGYDFEVTPVRAYDSPDWVEDMELYVDVEPAVPSDVLPRDVPRATEEADNLLEATDYALKLQYADRVIGRAVLPSLTQDEKHYAAADSIATKWEPTPSLEYAYGLGAEADSGSAAVIKSPETLELTLPTKQVASSNPLLVLGGLLIGGYLLYTLFNKSDSKYYPKDKLPRYAGGKRRL